MRPFVKRAVMPCCANGPIFEKFVRDAAVTTWHQSCSAQMGRGPMERQIASSWEGRIARRLRKKIEMLFAHLKRILKLDGSDYEERMVRAMSSFSQRPPKTSES
jgi:hypothetical protein